MASISSGAAAENNAAPRKPDIRDDVCLLDRSQVASVLGVDTRRLVRVDEPQRSCTYGVPLADGEKSNASGLAADRTRPFVDIQTFTGETPIADIADNARANGGDVISHPEWGKDAILIPDGKIDELPGAPKDTVVSAVYFQARGETSYFLVNVPKDARGSGVRLAEQLMDRLFRRS